MPLSDRSKNVGKPAKKDQIGFGAAAFLRPHRLKTFKISSDPQFAEKVIDVVGLYMDPPDNDG